MDDFAADLRRQRAIHLLPFLFFVSGATALVYQTLWARQLHLVFGTSTFAISTVLATFMAGLALGGFAMGRSVDRLPRPLAVYGGLEVGIGAYALAFPLLLSGLEPIYVAVGRTLSPSPIAYGLVQFVLVGGALLLPTAAMGATLPLLARFATRRLGAAGNQIGLLYGVNTAGAVAGTLAAGFFLLPSWGLSATTWVAGVANLLLGGAALALSRSTAPLGDDVVDDLPDADLPRDADIGLVSAVAALAGAAALIDEVAWTRVLGLILGASVYAFSVMLVAFLVGIATGGALGGPLADRALILGGRRRLLLLLAGLQIGVAATAYALLWAFGELPFWYVRLFDAFDVERNPGTIVVLGLVLAGAIMTPPAILMGATFPVAVRAAIGDPTRLGGPVGRIYGWNTVGSMVGAFGAGFVLLPSLGVQRAVLVGVTLNLLGALAIALRLGLRPGGPFWIGGTVALSTLLMTVLRPPWDPLVMTAGLYKYASYFDDHSRDGVLRFATGRTELLFYEEGLSSVVTVARNRKSGNVYLANNGKVDASTSGDMPTQVLLGLIPLHLHDDPKDVLVIGLASGVTVGAVTRHLGVERIDVVELEPAVVAAEDFFDGVNHRATEDPRVRVLANDGRNHVLLTEPGTYDVVVSEPPNPWITGVANLFTREFFELGRSRLKPGGVWAQWLHLYGMDEFDLRALLGTFADVYPYVSVYGTIEDADLVLVGSTRPLPDGPDAAEALWAHSPAMRKELQRVDIDGPLELTAIRLFGRDAALHLAEGVRRNTDDNMRIEYSAPWNLHASTHDRNTAVMIPVLELPPGMDDPDRLEALAWVYQSRHDIPRAVKALLAAARAVPEDDPRRREWATLIRQWRADLAGRG